MNRILRHGGWTLLLALTATAAAWADDETASTRVLQYDWLQPTDQQQEQAARYGTFTATAGEALGSDPFAVVASGSLWQDQQSVTYSRAMGDNLSFKCSSSSVTEDGTANQMGSQVRAESSYQPVDGVTVTGNVHDSDNDQTAASQNTSGAGASIETHLPLDTVFTAAVNKDQAQSEAEPGFDTSGYDAQLQKPVGKLPLSLVLKSHYEETTSAGAIQSRMPSLEQSLVWKPADTTTLQAGLRQEQYQDIPGMDNELNQALFADWSQKVLGDNFSWHSYAEMINTRSTVQIAEAGAGSNGTPQPTVPQGGTSLNSTLPVTSTDEKVTFSTGPSVQLQENVIASLQYSSSWDQSPAAGTAGQEQRVSVSLKGTF